MLSTGEYVTVYSINIVNYELVLCDFRQVYILNPCLGRKSIKMNMLVF